MMRNSLICKLINVQANIKENNEKKIKIDDEISKLIKAFLKDIAALDKRSVLANVNSHGSGIYKPSLGQIPKLGDDNEWKDVQKKDINNRPSEIINIRNTRNNNINKISYFLFWIVIFNPGMRRHGGARRILWKEL